MPGTVAVVLKGYPRLSETFIAQELLGLERRGHRLHLYSLRHPTDAKTHPVHGEIAAPVTYLPEYLHQEPGRVLRAWWRVRRRAAYRAAWRLWWRDLRRDPTRNRVRRWGQALVLAAEMPEAVGAVYVHFLHTPGSVGRYAARLRGRPLAISAHARDIWTIPDWEKAEKLAETRWTVTCTASGAAHLDSLAPGRVTLLHHGLDLTRFPSPEEPPASDRDGTDPAVPVRLLAVGRAVRKKGLDLLLHALAALPEGVHWRLDHIGGGAESRALKALADELGLSDRVTWHGARDQAEVLAMYRTADLFVLPCRIDTDGDRDGLPNVLMEAQSQRLACLSTRLSGIPELIEDGTTGVLVEPEDVPALTAALAALIGDPARRARLGAAGETRVRALFDARAGLDRLAAMVSDLLA
ncbi:glycosyltransferase family 4 protein [Roseospira marina]|uniref:Glycosyltransferase family 4 protein n=1 Tax=Roseospira marina TaxID=140057 RepID=A0A5M6IFR3_9PROT|nr:glycosyltransferase family 4 protein [Roseospira marina]KAA5606767.1 glycosyltransferase family 4 protein [Roseospira marina]MBB4313811.1 glycosyltransferase involved in cell wall biosynthesis [Roseospira marina]MBB5086973.1 glycosyltransferase involved in cell wall biosynthesis [Roseospira marina]